MTGRGFIKGRRKVKGCRNRGFYCDIK